MSNEDNDISGSLVLGLRKWWRHVQAKNCFQGQRGYWSINYYYLLHFNQDTACLSESLDISWPVTETACRRGVTEILREYHWTFPVGSLASSHEFHPFFQDFFFFLASVDIMYMPCNRGMFVYNICLISISNSVSDGATNKSVLNIESS